MTFIDKIMAYENGELNGKEVVELFAELIETGQAWALQGSYGRVATNLINRGLISKQGKVNWIRFQELSTQ